MRVRSASWLFATQVIGAAVGFATSIMLARALGPSGKGTVSVAQTIASIGGVALALGLPGAAGYLGAKRLVGGRTEAKLAWVAAVAITTVPLILVVVWGQPIAEALFRTPSAAYVILGVVALVPTLASQICGSFLLGIGRPRALALVTIAANVTSLLGIGLLALLGMLTPLTAILCWLLTLLMAAIGVTVNVVRTEDSTAGLSAWGAVRVGSSFGVASWMSSSFQFLALRADMLLLAVLANTAAVGVYSVGVSIAEISWYLPNALYGVLFPKVASEGHDTQYLVAKLSRLTWPIVLLSSLGLLTFAYLVVPVVFGPAFVGSISVVAALVPGATCGAVSNVLSSYLAGVGRPIYATVASGASLVSNVVLNLILIPSMGVVGAALASSGSYTLGAALTVLFFKRQTGMKLAPIIIPTTADLRELAAGIGDTVSRGLRRRDP